MTSLYLQSPSWTCLMTFGGGLTPISSWAPTEFSTHPPHSRTGKRIRRAKARKICGLQKRVYKWRERKKKEKCDAQPASKHQLLWKNSPPNYCWAWCQMVWNFALVNLGQQSQLCSLSASWPAPAYSTGGRGQSEKQKRLWHCASTAQQEHWCVITLL